MSVVKQIVTREEYRRLPSYIKEGRIKYPDDESTYCRGAARAAMRRLQRKDRERWRQANVKAAPFMVKIRERLMKAHLEIMKDAIVQREARRRLLLWTGRARRTA